MAIREGIQLAWVFSLIIACISLPRCFSLNSEGVALLAFQRGIREDPHGAFSNWNSSDESPCEWRGIRCSDGNVISLKLVNLSLSGILTMELERLANLQHLLLSGNNLSGDIPEELGCLTKLQILDLGNNHLTGEIPEDFGKLLVLEVLILENNLLEGTIPAQFGNLLSLKELRLTGNFLKGHIPGNQTEASDISESHINSAKGSNFESNCFYSGNGVLRQRTAEEYGMRLQHVNKRKLLHKSARSPGDTDFYTEFSPSPQSRNSAAINPYLPRPPSQPGNLADVDLFPPSSPSSQPKHSHNSHIPRPAPTGPQKALHSSKQSSSWMYGLIGALPGFVAFLLVLLVVGVFCYKRRSAAVSPWKAGMSGQLQKMFATEVATFSRAELQSACEDFSNIIETAPDSVIFKGTLSNGKEVAVSRLKVPPALWTENFELAFRQKIESLARMKHKQLLSVVGYCEEEDPFERMLVFEYAPNGTLFDQLHNGYAEILDWNTRMRIVMGAAYGLGYMHHELVPPMSHSNFDSNAIHLTEDFATKLADFGVFKSIGVQFERKQLSDLLRYDKLDYFDQYTPSFENDIFNFGVFLLEVLSGRTPYNDTYGYLVEWAMKYLHSPERIMEMVDPCLKAYDCQQVQALFDIIHLCILPDPKKRPSMQQVASMLSKAIDISPEAACPKSSPLLWAELEILAPI